MRKRTITTFVAHLAGWLFLFSLVVAFLYHMPQRQGLTVFVSWHFLLFCSFYLFVFYFNSGYLIPKLYLRQRYWLYFFILFTMFVAAWFLQPFDNLMATFRNDPPPPPVMEPPFGQGPPARGPKNNNTDIVSIVLFLMVWSLSTAICIVRQWRLTEKRAIEAETEKANAELSFLKAQINPHFLFNTLNNIYSMASMKHENTAASILKLSNIMRYVTEDAHENFVPLANEVECIKDYIDLQKLRLNSKTDVQFSLVGNIHAKDISPLLLMTFVENAFKYGTSSHETASIVIKLAASAEGIIFSCINTLFDQRTNMERTGIGISNARQRLQHQYAGKHLLSIATDGGFYTVHLTLEV